MSDTQQKTASNNRLVLLLIGGIPLTMILAASWLWYFVMRGDIDLIGMLGTANRGTLVQPPRQLDEVSLTDPAGAAITFGELEPRWAMLVPGRGDSCDATCESTLYTTRQIHVALGKEFNRIRRLHVRDTAPADTTLTITELSDGSPAPADFADYLDREHRGLKIMQLSTGDHDGLFAEYNQEPGTWYLVDPAGWIMMSYNSDIPYKDVISDLKFLLKNSGD